jgi:hypothetical protein
MLVVEMIAKARAFIQGQVDQGGRANRSNRILFMPLIGRFLPGYQFVERHAISITVTPAAALDAVAAYNPSSDPYFRFLIYLREVPAQMTGWLLRRQTMRRAPFRLGDFLLLGRDADREIAFGLVGRFWRGDYGLVQLADPSAFEAFDRPGILRLAVISGSGASIDNQPHVMAVFRKGFGACRTAPTDAVLDSQDLKTWPASRSTGSATSRCASHHLLGSLTPSTLYLPSGPVT